MNPRVRALLVAVATLLATLTVAATPAAAASSAALSLNAIGATVHTANGQAWHFGIYAYPDGGDSQGHVTYDLTETLAHTFDAATGSTESHVWDMRHRAGSPLTFTPATGRGALTTSNVRTTLKMAFSATSHRDEKCSVGSARDYAGTLIGQATLHTGLKKGGTVGGSHLAFTASGVHLTVDNGCSPVSGSNKACVKSAYFYASAPQHSAFGFTSPYFNAIELEHSVAVTPTGSTRSDVVDSKPSRAPVFDSKSGTLKVYASAHGLVVGAGKVVGGTVSRSSQACTVGSVKHTEHQISNFSAKFTNVKANPILAKSTLTGILSMPNGARTDYEVDTWS